MAERYSFYGFVPEAPVLPIVLPKPAPDTIEFDFKEMARHLIDAIASDVGLHARLRIALECRP